MISISTFLKKSYVRKDGMSAIYLQVIFDREVLHIPIKAYWYPAHWKNGRAAERFANDRQAKDLNLIIQDNEARANEILIQYRLRRKVLTKPLFQIEWINKKPQFVRFGAFFHANWQIYYWLFSLIL